MSNNYSIFEGAELVLADRIQKLRLQMLVHSCLYYEMDTNIITDKQWDSWAKELYRLQTENPKISEQVMWYEAFKDWDASTGAFLPLKDPWVINKAKRLLHIRSVPVKKPEVKKPKGQITLF